MKKNIYLKKIISIILAISFILSYTSQVPAADKYKRWDQYDLSEAVVFKDYNIDNYKRDIRRHVENDVYGYINNILKDYPDYTENKEKYIKVGNYVDISVLVCVDNEAEPSVKVSSIILHYGDKENENYLPTQVLEELEGRKVGEKFKITIKSASYNTSFGGQKADYYITINRMVSPKFYAYDNITEEYAQKLGFDNVNNLKATLEGEIKNHLDEIQNTATQEYLFKQCSVKISRKLIQQKTEQYIEILINQAFNNNEDEYNASIPKMTGLSVEDYESLQEKKEEKNVPIEMIYLAIAEKEGITVDEEGFKAYCKQLANEDSNGSVNQLFYLYDSSYEEGEDYLRRQYKIKKVVSFLNDYDLGLNTEFIEEHEEETVIVPTEENTDMPELTVPEAIDGAGFKIFTIPPYRGFKSYMDYRTITNTSSKQYRLQQYALSSYNGLRMVNGRYLIAVGTHLNAPVGTFVDIQLENGTMINCIVGDIKADKDTDVNNLFTKANNCCSEFIIDENLLPSSVLVTGNVSNISEAWNSPVSYFYVYDLALPL